ncbi:hypothetical protein TSH100_29155 [Azospirillum sp. TSH100]|nr:hypothetical protein TSH100_29155 [Azospirillum sp. TSH100]
MVDLVALPLWVGSLMQSRNLDAQQAGMLVTAYILGVFGGSLTVSRRLGTINNRLTATVGFLLGAASFFGLMAVDGLAAMAALHLAAGIGAGWGLSMTHGAMARSLNPHRFFGLGNLGTAVFAILFFATVPAALETQGVRALFLVLGGLQTVAAIAAALAFPSHGAAPATSGEDGMTSGSTAPVAPLSVRMLVFLGVACLATTQAMIFGFIERIGVAHGFGGDRIGLVLLVSGFVNLTAPLVAAMLERRLSHLAVSVCAVPLHAACGAAAVLMPDFLPYAVCAIAFVWLVIFGHIFIFALIATLDPSGRTAASTPAMLMVGAAIGPILGGTLANGFGYDSLALAGCVLGALGGACLALIARLRPVPPGNVCKNP